MLFVLQFQSVTLLKMFYLKRKCHFKNLVHLQEGGCTHCCSTWTEFHTTFSSTISSKSPPVPVFENLNNVFILNENRPSTRTRHDTRQWCPSGDPETSKKHFLVMNLANVLTEIGNQYDERTAIHIIDNLSNLRLTVIEFWLHAGSPARCRVGWKKAEACMVDCFLLSQS